MNLYSGFWTALGWRRCGRDYEQRAIYVSRDLRWQPRYPVRARLPRDIVSLIEPSFVGQTAISVGSKSMDTAFRGDELFVGCHGDGSAQIIDIAGKRHKASFSGGTDRELLRFTHEVR